MVEPTFTLVTFVPLKLKLNTAEDCLPYTTFVTLLLKSSVLIEFLVTNTQEVGLYNPESVIGLIIYSPSVKLKTYSSFKIKVLRAEL